MDEKNSVMTHPKAVPDPEVPEKTVRRKGEIDPSVASNAIALLTWGLLSLTAKRKRRKEDRR